MDEIIKERIDFEIENRFYYIGYPKNVPDKLWKDREGKFLVMDQMGLDHLKASIKMIQRDKEAFLKTYEKDRNGPELTKILIPLVDKKLKELKDFFKEKSRL